MWIELLPRLPLLMRKLQQIPEKLENKGEQTGVVLQLSIQVICRSDNYLLRQQLLLQ
jgi:hypothetical protein